uniref:PO3Cd1.11 n=1 Tax=uncultured Lysobacteraceae bacterium TaxID=211441 RepID=J9V259_9GAMM|nr:pO3Cd1.11 [uncultured Xanthomonadaceae bacterium]
MHRSILARSLGFALVASLAVGCSKPAVPASDPRPGSAPAPAPAPSMAGHSAGSMELDRIMAEGPKMPMPMSGDVDKDFATMMTMHHRQAIKMADVLLQTGRSDELKALAAKMKAAQTEEISQLAPYAQ